MCTKYRITPCSSQCSTCCTCDSSHEVLDRVLHVKSVRHWISQHPNKSAQPRFLLIVDWFVTTTLSGIFHSRACFTACEKVLVVSRASVRRPRRLPKTLAPRRLPSSNQLAPLALQVHQRAKGPKIRTQRAKLVFGVGRKVSHVHPSNNIDSPASEKPHRNQHSKYTVWSVKCRNVGCYSCGPLN